ncbi:acetylornithine/N-succinyldiaminopimelate aminotransferase [Limimonas halophila]|uniref:Acetylornithine aminotransferase n=2 Tax=Limimonas halophila TaxID=1082479 RepID=A0A1G7TZP4_9PROT|nr:acetylornithine/N-succinyldiaminopimelate aminotransferase [Limimonas halophila]
MPTYARADVAFERGEGAYLQAEDGSWYLDFGTGIAVTALGHAHPHLVEALTTQAEKLWHVSNLYRIPASERLAERLTANSFGERVFFCNSGVEAFEGAVKIARRYHHSVGNSERYRVITFEQGFHGRSLAGISASSGAKLRAGFEPLTPGFDQVPFNDAEAARAAVTGETAAVMLEPVQGDGGIRPADPQFLREVRRICDEHGLLLIADEIQCGMGRTGALFAHQWAGIRPDVMALAKGMGSGFPVGAVVATLEAAQGMTPGTHGSTFGGNPLAMAVGNAVLDVMLEDGFLANVRTTGARLREELDALARRHPELIRQVRGSGLMLGLQAQGSNLDLVNAFRAEGLLTVPGGDNVVRVLPPLIITDHHIDDGLARMDRACQRLAATEPR